MGYQTYLTDPKGAYAAQFNSYGGSAGTPVPEDLWAVTHLLMAQNV